MSLLLLAVAIQEAILTGRLPGTSERSTRQALNEPVWERQGYPRSGTLCCGDPF